MGMFIWYHPQACPFLKSSPLWTMRSFERSASVMLIIMLLDFFKNYVVIIYILIIIITWLTIIIITCTYLINILTCKYLINILTCTYLINILTCAFLINVLTCTYLINVLTGDSPSSDQYSKEDIPPLDAVEGTIDSGKITWDEMRWAIVHYITLH